MMLTKFPPLLSFKEPVLESLGYTAFAISAFDHWFTEEEASSNSISYQDFESPIEALKYSAIEISFWKLHLILSKDPVFRVLRNGNLVPVDPRSRKFQDLWRSSRREFRPRSQFLDLYYLGDKVRMIHNWDLTDWVFFRDVTNLRQVEIAVKEAGLHILH